MIFAFRHCFITCYIDSIIPGSVTKVGDLIIASQPSIIKYFFPNLNSKMKTGKVF